MHQDGAIWLKIPPIDKYSIICYSSCSVSKVLAHTHTERFEMARFCIDYIHFDSNDEHFMFIDAENEMAAEEALIRQYGDVEIIGTTEVEEAAE